MTDDAPRDAQLVEAARRGDRDAFGQLVTRYQGRLLSAMLGRVSSYEDAADAVQDAFVQAYRKLDSFRGESQFYTWLFEIAKNMAYSQGRRKKPTESIENIKTNSGGEPRDRNLGPEGAAQSQEKVESVRAAMARLSDEHREILVLRNIEGRTYDEIAKLLQLEVGTVKSRIFRARSQLKQLLDAQWGDRGQAPTKEKASS